MRKIPELHVEEAKIDAARESAMRELQRFSKSVPSGKAKARLEIELELVVPSPLRPMMCPRFFDQGMAVLFGPASVRNDLFPRD
jgi:hypothetical protein